MLMDPQRNKELKQDIDEHEIIGEGLGFERTRRITGYLVGTLDRFNNAKRAEERDRVKHI
jgi:anaerobic ribonucleoside-triphosphate reductase